MARGLAHDVVDVPPGKCFEMRLDGEVDVPLLLWVVAVAAADVLHPLDDVHDTVGPGQGVAELDETVVLVVNHAVQSVGNDFRFFGRRVTPAYIVGQRLVIEGMTQADPGHLVVPQREHVAVAVHDMAEVPLAVPPPDVVEQPQHIGFVSIQPAGAGDVLGTVGCYAAVVAPEAGVVGLSFG